MSLRRGDRTKGAPKHQNAFAFRHNKNSKKTQRILAIPNVGVCRRCYDIIEWRKKYRKYKPAAQPGRCSSCRKRNVKYAYHSLCLDCGKRLSQCCKCFTPMDHASDRSAPVSAESALEAELEYLLENTDADMKERERRSRIRELRRQLFGDAKSTGSGGSAERRCNVVADVVSEGPDEESAPASGGAPGPDAEKDCEAMDSGE